MGYKFLIKEASGFDKNNYELCLNNEEFRINLFNTNSFNTEKLLAPNEKDIKYVLHFEKNDKIEFLGFAHFYLEDNEAISYNLIGGISPKYFDSGIGIFVSVFLLNEIFTKRKVVEIRTGVYKYNKRSLRMLIALGFIVEKENNLKYYLSLKKNDFPNHFAIRLLERVSN